MLIKTVFTDHSFSIDLQDCEVQRQIEREVRIREGACKLLAACSQRDQALEASKTLLTSNSRILALMTQLQRMKEAQAMQKAGRRYITDLGLALIYSKLEWIDRQTDICHYVWNRAIDPSIEWF